MAKEVVSKEIFELLEKHLVDIEEEGEQILEKYFPDITAERDSFTKLLTNYIKQLEKYISKYEVSERAENNCPFIIIGSIVEVEDLESKEVEKYQIVSPFENNLEVDFDFASYLSPLGKALLLKKIDDKVEVETPMGKFTYKVKSIEIPAEILN
ncbi:MAG TPA: GreA/GreB family elongation factor [Clostridia bacterium]|jgi:transcription elongation factor GreA|nr:GreA/GreB family elongation factor [Clostridia bacterium]